MAPDTRFVLLLVLFLSVLVLCTKPLGSYIADVMEGRPNLALRLGGRLEALIYRICGVEPGREMAWNEYAIALMLFNVLGGVLVYGLLRLQAFLPLNPQHLPAVAADTAFNTAVSFITNTNWQSYSGESTLGYLAQMAGLAVQNFLSAATGIAVAVALIRGFARHGAKTIGNFWVDVTRSTIYLLLPLSLILAIVLASQGVVQNFAAYKDAATIETLTYQNPKTDAAGHPLTDAAGSPVMETATTQTQTLPMGPVASQEAIKELGTNGGGFFNANSAHPFENPTPLTGMLEMLAMFLIAFALTYTFGKMVGDVRQGWVLLITMLILFVPLVLLAFHVEQHGNPLIAHEGVDQIASSNAGRRQHGRQGDALRDRGLGPVERRRDRDIERRRQYHA